jgi:chitinase
MFTGILPSGKRSLLSTVKQAWFDQWSTKMVALRNLPPIGGPNGRSPDTINGRIMLSLGGTGFLEPFSLLEKQINIAKGHLFAKHQPIDLSDVTDLALAFVREDTRSAADKLLSPIRNVS